MYSHIAPPYTVTVKTGPSVLSDEILDTQILKQSNKN